jgi:hypothetical protein
MNLKMTVIAFTAYLFAIPAQAAVYDLESPALGISAFITTSDTLDSIGGYDILAITGTLSGFGNITGIVSNPTQPFPSQVVWWPSLFRCERHRF